MVDILFASAGRSFDSCFRSVRFLKTGELWPFRSECAASFGLFGVFLGGLRNARSLLFFAALAAVIVLVAGAASRLNRHERRIGITEPIRTLDPLEARGAIETDQIRRLFQTLYLAADTPGWGETAGLIAEGPPEFSHDGLLASIRIRKGIFFSDDPCFPGGRGRELTAEDVVFSLRRIFSHPSTRWIWGDKVEAAEAIRVGPRGELLIQLKRPYFPLRALLALPALSVLPEEAVAFYGESLRVKPVGSGEYVLGSWSPKGELLLQPRAQFAKSKPTLRLLPIVDGESLPENLDRIAVRAFRPSLKGLLFNGADKDYRVSIARKAELTLTALNFRNPVLRDTRVRQALSLALDVKDAIPIFYDGYAEPAQIPLPPQHSGALGQFRNPYRSLDMKAARAKLTEAGFPHGKGFPVLRYVIPRDEWSSRQGEFLREAWKQLGIQLELLVVNETEAWPIFISGKADFIGLAIPDEMGDPDLYLQFFYSKGGGQGIGIHDPELDRLIERSREVRSPKIRASLVEAMVRRIADHCYAILGVYRYRVFYDKKSANLPKLGSVSRGD